MKINQIISEIDRRGFLKGIGAVAASAATGASYGQNNDELSLVQRQYDWQFAEQLGGDKIIKIVPREAGGKVAITARGKYFLMMPYNEIKHTLPSGMTKGPTDILLMKVPSQILSGNTTQKKIDTQLPQKPKSSSSYENRVKARIKPNITISSSSEQLEETGSVTVEIRTSPDGTIISRKVVGSSGFRRLDDAVLKAIDRTEVLPRDEDGRVPPTISLTFNLKE